MYEKHKKHKHQTKTKHLKLNLQNKMQVSTFICKGKSLGISTSTSYLDNTMAYKHLDLQTRYRQV